ncbi:MAG: glycosyltransferase family 2 protein [Anaerolineales bacterium]|nr:glycosyltransferase family 2 protein [Anaerolineales bacterium]
MHTRLSIVIPCYNEVENIPKMRDELLPVLARLAEEYSVQVVFVDDGSNDGTLDSFKEAFTSTLLPNVEFDYLQHQINLGLGAAIRTGLAACQGSMIITTDSDGTYHFSSMMGMLKYLEGADIVTASPYHPDGNVVGVPKYRLLLSRGSSMIYRLLVEWDIYTYTCLFRAYRREVIDSVPFESNGFLFNVELLVKSRFKGFRVVEFPAVLYRRAFGVSKVKLIQTILDHLNFQGRIILYRLGVKSTISL